MGKFKQMVKLTNGNKGKATGWAGGEIVAGLGMIGHGLTGIGSGIGISRGLMMIRAMLA